jgi:hypothetical protein
MRHAPSGPTAAETRLQACCSIDDEPKIAPASKRGGGIAAVSAMLLAFLASQHHTIMMTLFAVGLSDAAMSFMTAAPLVRDAMLGMSVGMIGVVGWQIRDPRRPRSMRIMGAVSIVATLGLAGWSILHFGV